MTNNDEHTKPRQSVQQKIIESGECPVCKARVEKTDEHGPLIDHADTCALTSTHPESRAAKERAARAHRQVEEMFK